MAEDETLTPDKVRQRVAAVLAAAEDPEAAHAEEDQLYADILRTIAEWGDRHEEDILDWIAMCQEAIKTQDADMTRWYA